MTEANTAEDDCLMTDPGLPNGTTLSDGQFTITRRLSAGGFGITYLAEDNILGRTIVIKECFPEELCARIGTKVRARTAQQVDVLRSIAAMFMHEARSLAKLRHPNIVGVHNAFEENGTAYMALDLIDGYDLLDILEDEIGTPPTPDRVKEILLQLLGAVETIHNHDLLHRDISPDNIIIENTGTPVLIDFGAARADASRRTRAVSSMIVVKDGYSPQEFYVAGSVQTPSSDLYALAATFYHVLGGVAPPNSQIRMAEMVGQNPDPCIPLAGRFAGYDPAFLAAIDKAMSVVPRDRLQSAAEWRALISDHVVVSKDVAPAISTAPAKPVTQDVERMLTRMIQETNELVEQSEPKATAPATVAKLAPRLVVSKPAWLQEFNAETQLEDDAPEPAEPIVAVAAPVVLDIAEPEPIAPEPIPVTHISETDFTEKNWAARVIAKNQQSQALQADQLKARSGQGAALEDEIDLSGGMATHPNMLEGLAKYLITGIVLGLASLMVLPNLL